MSLSSWRHVPTAPFAARLSGVPPIDSRAMRLERLPPLSFLFGPSPVHPLDRLTEHLGGAALWAKRDDCNSGLAYGGNKTRKLEYLVADASTRAATRSSRSAACSPTTRARSRPARRGRG